MSSKQISLDPASFNPFLELVKKNAPLPYCSTNAEPRKATIEFSMMSIHALKVEGNVWDSLRTGLSSPRIYFQTTLTTFNTATARVYGQSFSFLLGQVMKSGKELTGSEEVVFWIDDKNELTIDALQHKPCQCFADPLTDCSILLCEFSLISENGSAATGWTYIPFTTSSVPQQARIYEGTVRSLFLLHPPLDLNKENFKSIPNAFLFFKLHVSVDHVPLFFNFFHENTFLIDGIPNYSTDCTCVFTSIKLKNLWHFDVISDIKTEFRLCFGAHNAIKFITQIYKACPVFQDCNIIEFPDLKMVDHISHQDVYLIFWIEWQIETQWVTLAWGLVPSLNLGAQNDEEPKLNFQVELFSRPFFYWKPFFSHGNENPLLLTFQTRVIEDDKEKQKIVEDELSSLFKSCNVSLPPLLPKNSQIQKSPILRAPCSSTPHSSHPVKNLALPTSRSPPNAPSNFSTSTLADSLATSGKREPLLLNNKSDGVQRKTSILYAFSDPETFFSSKTPSHVRSMLAPSFLEDFSSVRASDTFQTLTSRPDSGWGDRTLSRTLSTSSGSTLHSISTPFSQSPEILTTAPWTHMERKKLEQFPFSVSFPDTSSMKKQEDINMHLEARDPFLIHHLSIHFIGCSTISGANFKGLKFLFNFYTQFKTSESPELTLQHFEKDLPALFQVQGQPFYGYLYTFAIDLTDDFPFTFSANHCHFLEYLRSADLEIHVWNAETSFPLGIAKLPLVHLLRQGEPSTSCFLSTPIFENGKDVRLGTLFYILSNTGELHPTYRSWRDVLLCKHTIQVVDDYHSRLCTSYEQPLCLESEPIDLNQVLHFPNLHHVAQRAKLLSNVAAVQAEQSHGLLSLFAQHVEKQRTSHYSAEVKFGRDHVFEFIVSRLNLEAKKLLLFIDHLDVTLLTTPEEWDYYSIDATTFEHVFKKESSGYSFEMTSRCKSCTLPLLFHSRSYAPSIKVHVHLRNFHDSSICYCSLEATFQIHLPEIRNTLTYFLPLATPFSTSFTLDRTVLSIQSVDPDVDVKLLGPNVASLKFCFPSTPKSVEKKEGFLVCYTCDALHFCVHLVAYGYPLVSYHATFGSCTKLTLKTPKASLVAYSHPPSFVASQLVSNHLREIELIYQPRSIDIKEDQGIVHCLDPNTKEILCGWILNFQIQPPKVSKSFKVQPSAKYTIPKRIKFRNSQPDSHQFNVSSTHPNLLILREKQFRLDSFQEIYLHLTLLPNVINHFVDVYINIREENGLHDEWFSIQICANS